MTVHEKLLTRFIENPASLPFRDIEKILLRFGFDALEARGSHKKFKHLKVRADVIIPLHNGECKNFYKRELAKILKANGFLKRTDQEYNHAGK